MFRPLALIPLLIAGCSSVDGMHDGGTDLSVGDLSVGDLSVGDLAVSDHSLPPADGASGTQLREGPCPPSLSNDRCYFPPGIDLGFY